MSKKSLKILLVLVTILSLISTFSFATDTTVDEANTPVTTSVDDATVISDDNSENSTTTDSSSESTSTEASTNNDLYLIEDSVTIADSETVNGNVFVIGNTVTINGQIGGDLFVIADTLNIDGGQIYGNVFTLANNITLNGLIYDLYGVCDTLTMSYDGIAYRDLKVKCDTANLNGVVGKSVNIEAKKALNIETDCIIYGDLNYTAASEITVPEGIVTGNVNYEKISLDKSNSVWNYIFSALSALVFTLIIWLLMSKIAPKFYGKVNNMPTKKMLISILIGLAAIILVPLVAFLLMITVIGIPVAFALIAIFALIISVSFATATIGISNKLANKVKSLAKFNNLFAVIIMSLVLWALVQIPFAGIVISFLLTLCGLGMFLSSITNKKNKTKNESPVEVKAE